MISSRFSGSPSGTGYPPICSAPPPAPGTGIECDYCPNAPAVWAVHPYGITNTVGPHCSLLNHIYLLPFIGFCTWEYELTEAEKPNTDTTWTWTFALNNFGSSLKLRVEGPGSLRWQTPNLPPRNGAPISLPLIHADARYCTNWPPNILLTPA